VTLAHTLVVTVALLACAEGSAAQTLSLRVQDGRATLEARGVSARQIVAEWAAQTEATVVGSDALSPEPVTLHLVEVPERVALDIILRAARGYILGAGPRRTAASNFGLILIMPATSHRSPASPSESSAAGQRPIDLRPPTDSVLGTVQVGLDGPEQELVDISEGLRDQQPDEQPLLQGADAVAPASPFGPQQGQALSRRRHPQQRTSFREQSARSRWAPE